MSRTSPRAFPVPGDEAERLGSLAAYGITGAPELPDLPSVVELAAYICGVPTAVVNIISATEQLPMAAYDFEAGACARGDSMCAISIVEPEPVVVPDATRDPRFAGNPFVTGEIADNGIGIPAADRPRVLEMFTRLRTDVEGSGIGLATCQRIIEAHDAQLVIDGTPGGGTTMRISLPRPVERPALAPAG